MSYRLVNHQGALTLGLLHFIKQVTTESDLSTRVQNTSGTDAINMLHHCPNNTETPKQNNEIQKGKHWSSPVRHHQHAGIDPPNALLISATAGSRGKENFHKSMYPQVCGGVTAAVKRQRKS